MDKVSESTALVSAITSDATSAIEKILGDPNGPANVEALNGAIVTREGANAIKRAVETKLRVQLNDPNDQIKSWTNRIVNEMMKSVSDLDSIEKVDRISERFTVWTPEIGRLEIKPTVGKKLDLEQELTTAYKSEVESRIKWESDFAKKYMKDEEWYNQRKGSKEDHGMFKTENSAGISGIDLSNDIEVSMTSNGTWDNVSAETRKKLEDLHNQLKSDTFFKQNLSQELASKWKGQNQLDWTKSKTLNLKIVKNVDLKKDFLATLNVSGTVESSVEVAEDLTIALNLGPVSKTIEAQLAEIKKELKERPRIFAMPIYIGSEANVKECMKKQSDGKTHQLLRQDPLTGIEDVPVEIVSMKKGANFVVLPLVNKAPELKGKTILGVQYEPHGGLETLGASSAITWKNMRLVNQEFLKTMDRVYETNAKDYIDKQAPVFKNNQGKPVHLGFLHGAWPENDSIWVNGILYITYLD